MEEEDKLHESMSKRTCDCYVSGGLLGCGNLIVLGAMMFRRAPLSGAIGAGFIRANVI